MSHEAQTGDDPTGDDPADEDPADEDPADEDPADEGATCGSRGLPPCPDGQYCEFSTGGAGAACGADDRGGRCRVQPRVCTTIYAPVCGCDGHTYSSACNAAAAGVSVATEGACEGGDNNGDGVSCDPRAILCKRVAPSCPDGQVPSVSGTCYGDCVPVGQCICSEPDACPDSDHYTCHNHAQRCGPYL